MNSHMSLIYKNSKRTKFYKKYLLKNLSGLHQKLLDEGEKLTDFNQESVLTRMEKQLKKQYYNKKYSSNKLSLEHRRYF